MIGRQFLFINLLISIFFSVCTSDSQHNPVIRLESIVYQKCFLTVRHEYEIFLNYYYQPQDISFHIVEGLATSNGAQQTHFVSFRTPHGAYLRHHDSVLYAEYKDNQGDIKQFEEDATFNPVQGLANEFSFSFESYNKPNHFISVDNNLRGVLLKRSTEDEDNNATKKLFSSSATWLVPFPVPAAH